VIYVPYEQQPRFGDIGNLVVRTTAPTTLRSVLDSEIRALGQEYISRAETVAQATEQTLSYERVTAILSTCFGGLALLLCGIGLFGLMSQTVSRQTREIGIRMALGSSKRNIVGLVLGQCAGLTAIGIVLGIPAAVAPPSLSRIYCSTYRRPTLGQWRLY
jgi:ABC-type antimicrobial peptide transport system permease subunit